MSDSSKRRLPLLQGNIPEEQRPPERPAWQWSSIGAVATFVVWLPLSGIATVIVRRIAGDHLVAASIRQGAVSDVPTHVHAAMIGFHALGFVLAAFSGGLLVRRLGGKTGKEAATGGLLAATIAWALAASQGTSGAGLITWGLLLVLLGGLGAGSGWLGGRVGMALRNRKR